MSATRIPSSTIIYQGPSLIDGKPIVAVATGISSKSDNRKTGDMVQVWIIRADMDPLAASRSGADVSICGDCKHRGNATDRSNGIAVGRSCYVTLQHAPLSIFNTFVRGSYVRMDRDLATVAAWIAGKPVRIGAYGDPAAVPFWVWQAICPGAAFVNGYTHQWSRFPELAEWCMASVDSEDERAAAKLLGFRTFRVRAAAEPVAKREVVCPASEEAGKRASCASCRACGGHSAKAKADMVIIAHGTPAVNFERARLAA